MAQTTHGVGGLTFDASKRHRPPELNILFGLILIVAVFEALGWLLIGDSFLFNTRANVAHRSSTQPRLSIIILQVSIVGIIAIGVTQVIISGGIDLSSGSVVGATAMIAMSFAQVAIVNGQPEPEDDAARGLAGPAGDRADRRRPRLRPDRRADQRRR